jgi:hypothetical protein
MKKQISSSVRQFAVVACRNLANTTQPFSGRDKESSQAGRKLGEKAVRVDINKVFYVPMSNGGFVKALTKKAEMNLMKIRKNKGKINNQTEKFRKRLNQYISSGNTSAIREIAKDMKWKNIYNTVRPELHQAARTGKRKKTRKPIGGMHVILNTNDHLQRYIEKKQRMVGLAKAGWAKCADLIPTDNKGSATRGIPQWVTRHRRKANGAIQDQSRNVKNPKVIMTNKIPWASNVITPNETRKAVELAKRTFVEFMNRTMKGELRRRAKLKGV